MFSGDNMQVVTIKAKPKTIFGVVLALTGILVIILTFAFNHPEKAARVSRSINCATSDERREFISSLGYETDIIEEQKDIIIPKQFNMLLATIVIYVSISKSSVGNERGGYFGRTGRIYMRRNSQTSSAD